MIGFAEECRITAGNISDVLRETLRRLEQNGTFDSNDPALIHLKRQLVLAIAELETKKDFDSSAERPVIVLRVRKSRPVSRKSNLEFR